MGDVRRTRGFSVVGRRSSPVERLFQSCLLLNPVIVFRYYFAPSTVIAYWYNIEHVLIWKRTIFQQQNTKIREKFAVFSPFPALMKKYPSISLLIDTCSRTLEEQPIHYIYALSTHILSTYFSEQKKRRAMYTLKIQQHEFSEPFHCLRVELLEKCK